MPTAMPRRFRIRDAMLLILAAALGLGLASWGYGSAIDRVTGRWQRILGVYWAATLTAFPVTAMTVLLRLVQPRPSLRRLCAQPGFVGCSSVLVVFLCNFAAYFSGNLRRMGDYRTLRYAVSVSLSYTCVSPAVLCCWLLLLAGGRRHPEASWIDRLGRGLGVLWIAALPVMSLLSATPLASSCSG